MIITKTQFLFLQGLPVVVQQEDGGPWMPGMIIEGNSTDHNG